MQMDLPVWVLLNAGMAKHHADWNYEKICSPFARIYYVLEGEANVKIQNTEYVLTPNHLYLIPSFATHSDECTGIFSLYYLHIYETVSNSTSIFERFTFPFEIEATLLDKLLFERLLEINPERELQKYDPKFYDNTPTLLSYLAISAHTPFSVIMETNGILQQLFSRFLLNAEPLFVSTDKRILNSLVYITNNIEKEFSIAQLSEICHLSPDHFIRLFKNEMKCTPIVYINRKKIEMAQSLLLFTNRPVKDIAYQLSFGNITYFNRLFKKISGQTPVEYRISIGSK